jgi:hypothetical protein
MMMMMMVPDQGPEMTLLVVVLAACDLCLQDNAASDCMEPALAPVYRLELTLLLMFHVISACRTTLPVTAWSLPWRLCT